MRTELAVKLGSDEIVVYRKGEGILARVPAYVAVNKSGLIRFYGKDAFARVNTKNENLTIIQPIKNGVITDKELAVKLISHIFETNHISASIFKHVVGVVAVPCGLSLNDLETVSYVMKMSGIDSLRLVQSGACAREFENLWDKKRYVCVVDIGASITDISIVSGEDFHSGADYMIGGVQMNDAIQTFIFDNYFGTISKETAEFVKKDIGSLYNRDFAKSELTAVADDGSAKKIEIKAHEIRTAICGIYDKIFTLVKNYINEQGVSIINEIRNNGILFCGGATQIAGFYEYAKTKFDFPVHLSKNPMDAVLLGASKIVDMPNYPITIKL